MITDKELNILIETHIVDGNMYVRPGGRDLTKEFNNRVYNKLIEEQKS